VSAKVETCGECTGLGFVPAGWEDEPDDLGSWFIQNTQPCNACRCFDCATACGEYEVVIREGHPQPVCLECAVMSGDDNFNSYQEHQKEAKP
jgi:hypothetical protein